MIELSYHTLRNNDFISGMQKLATSTTLNTKVAYNVGRIMSKLQSAEKSGQETFSKLIRKYAEMDGDKIVEPEGPGSYKIADEKVEEYRKELEEFLSIEIKIDRNKIGLNDLEGAGLSPVQVLALDPLLTIMEAV